MGQEVTEQNGLSGKFQKTTSSMAINMKRMYSKEFLLSVAELDDCQKVPAGLDSSLLRENQPKLDERGVAIPGASSRGLIRTMRESDAHSASPPDVPEWRRPSSLPGSPFLKSGPRQTEPKLSSPRPGPARAGNNPARSIMGRSGSARWDMRSNGEDRDRDMNRTPQFEWELSSPTELGGRIHSKGIARSGLVVPQEHDGLLGSGGPIVHRGMIQTPTHDRHRADRTSRIGRAGEQYHSSHGGKVLRNAPASQLSRREDTDSVSDETFNSDDWPNSERSEQERQRRDKFEQMRKELRKKPLITARNNNDTWLGEGFQSTETFLSSPGTPQSWSSKDDVLKSQNKPVTTSSTPRLLVPPGFSKPNLSKIGSPKENHEASKSFSSHTKDDDANSFKQTSSTDGVKLDNKDQFSSLLLKLNQLEDENLKPCSPSQSPVMSKFARWFPSQGPNLKESGLNSEPLSVVTKNEDLQLCDFTSATSELSGGSEINAPSTLSAVTSLKSKGSVLPMPVGPSLEDVEKVMTAGASFGQVVKSNEEQNENNQAILDNSLPLLERDHEVQFNQTLGSLMPLVKDVQAKKVPPVFLTCEDLEQSLLSESVRSEGHPKLDNQEVDKNVNLMQLLEMGSSKRQSRSKGHGWVVEQDSGDVMDGSASTHLLSLLQKNAGGTSPLDDAINAFSVEACERSMGQNNHVEDQCSTAEIISLETLFGRKFVNELRSVGEPVSAKQLVDGSIYSGKEDTLINDVLFANNQSRRSAHTDTAFHEEIGWKNDSRGVVMEPKASEITSGSGLQDDLLTDVSVHDHPSLKPSKSFPSSRNVSVNGLSVGDVRQRKVSQHPQQGSYSHGEHYEGHRHPISETASHRLHQEPHVIHENSLYGLGMLPPNGLLYPFQEEFLRAGNHIPGHFEERSSVIAGTSRMSPAVSADHPESIQMSFNSSHGVSDPRIGGSRMNPLAGRWFPGDHIQASQGLPGFNPYQHQVIQERKAAFGVSGMGLAPGAQSYNIGLPDRRGQSEIPYDHYTLSGSRPSYG